MAAAGDFLGFSNVLDCVEYFVLEWDFFKFLYMEILIFYMGNINYEILYMFF